MGLAAAPMSRRADRIANLVQQEVARLAREDVRDPRVGDVSITAVSVNDDLSVARIRFLPFGGKGDRTAILEGLAAEAKRWRGPIGRALGIRHAPELRFELDRNIEYAAHMDEVFARLPKPAEDGEEPS